MNASDSMCAATEMLCNCALSRRLGKKISKEIDRGFQKENKGVKSTRAR